MKKTLILTSLIAVTQPIFANEAHPGKEIFTDNCTNCHAHKNEDLFIQKKQGFKTKAKLAGMVSRCVSMTGVDIFPEDEAQITDYLNKKYYHLK